MKRLLYIFVFILNCLSVLLAQKVDTLLLKRVDSLIKVSRDLTSKMDFVNALELNSIAEHISLGCVGRESVSYGNCSFNHGRIMYFRKEFPEAEKWYLESKMIREKLLGKEHPDYLNNLNNLGILYVDMGHFDKAESYFLDLKFIREKVFGQNNLDYANSLHNLGLLYYNKGEYEKAESFYIEAKDIREKLLGKQNLLYAWSVNNLAVLYVQIGKYEKAEALYIEATTIRETVLGKLHPDYASSLNNLGAFYHTYGNYEKAEHFYLEAKIIREKILGKLHSDYAVSLNNLAAFYFSIGNYEKAKSLFLESIAIREKHPGIEQPEYASCLANLAAVYWTLGDYKKAEPLLIESKTIRERILGTDHPNYSESLNNLATLYKDQNNFEMAEKIYLEAKAINEKILGKEHPQYADCINNLGMLYAIKGDNENSEALLTESKSIREKVLGKEHPAYKQSQLNLMSFYVSIGDYRRAEFSLKDFSTLSKLLLIKSIHYLSEQELNKYLLRFSTSQSEALGLAHLAIKALPNISEICYDNSIFYKGFLLNVSTQLKRLFLMDSISAEKVNTLKSYERRLAAEYTKPITARKNVLELENEANEIEKDLARTVSGYGKTIKQVYWKELKQKLNNNESAIEFVDFHIKIKNKSDSIIYAALIIRSDSKSPKYIPLFEKKQLDSLLQKSQEENFKKFYDKLYLDNNSATQTNLYNLIWKPLQKELKDIKTIYYSPSGILHRINLSAIPFNDNEIISDKYNLIEMGSTRNLVVGNISSDSIVSNDLSKVKSNDYAELYGGIEYDFDSTELFTIKNDSIESYASRNTIRGRSEELKFEFTDSMSRGGSWYYLKWTEKEVSSVEAILKTKNIKSKIYKSYSATEESFKLIGVNNPSPRILHIATHGYFFPDPKVGGRPSAVGDQEEPVFKLSDHPMIRSGLILAGGNHAWKTGKPFKEGMEDGILTAYEVSQMNLSNTELVVLSACETGLGDIQANEGVYGLQRAFKIAGAKYLIMSLWQVPDKQTKEFMETFYKRWLNDKLSIPEAFRKAQKEMQKKFVDPYSWAGFILVE